MSVIHHIPQPSAASRGDFYKLGRKGKICLIARSSVCSPRVSSKSPPEMGEISLSQQRPLDYSFNYFPTFSCGWPWRQVLSLTVSTPPPAADVSKFQLLPMLMLCPQLSFVPCAPPHRIRSSQVTPAQGSLGPCLPSSLRDSHLRATRVTGPGLCSQDTSCLSRTLVQAVQCLAEHKVP